MSKKILSGKIVSTKMQETASVLVERIKVHSKYKKQFKISKKYLAHNKNNKFKIGQNVDIVETKPISKNKHFIISSISKEKNDSIKK